MPRKPGATPPTTPAGGPSFRARVKMSALATIALERLGHDTYVADAGLFHRVHHRSESAEGHILVRSQEDGLVLRIADLPAQLAPDLVDIDRIVAQEYALTFVNRDYQPLFRDLLHRAGFGHIDFDTRLQHRRGDHKNNQQHQNHIHQRSDVDIGERRLGASVGSGESHYRRTSALSMVIRARGCWRSTAFSISSAKSSPRAANSRIDPPIRL